MMDVSYRVRIFLMQVYNNWEVKLTFENEDYKFALLDTAGME